MHIFKKILQPAPLPYDYTHWETLPFEQKAKLVCQAWATQGFGSPMSTHLFYLVKIAAYVWIWTWFCSFSNELGGMKSIGEWWFKTEAIEKAILWTTLLEVIGLGGASGPLTGRYLPPLGGITYFLRPNTIKLPLFPNAPFIGSDKRSLIDVVLYGTLLIILGKACFSAQINIEEILPIIILFPLLGVLDRTIYLAARADIYFPMICCFLFPNEALMGLKWMFFGIWFWAAFSKLTPSFPSVVCVMISNSPIFRFKSIRRLFYKNLPDDVRPSNLAKAVAHLGTLVEFVLPAILVLSNDPNWIVYAMVGLTIFHGFIFVNFPMGVPMEWNVMMVFGGWALFVFHPENALSGLTNPLLIALMFIALGVLPILGSLYPKYISFLLSMRYYAGTWAYSVWFFKGNSKEKIEKSIVKSSKDILQQLLYFFDLTTAKSVISRSIGFRLMHLPGRALFNLVPKVVENIADYQWVEGEFIAGEVLGWNFGDGHLHQLNLLQSVQKRCNFQEGELRVIMVESPQLHTQNLEWKIYDAKTGILEKGTIHLSKLAGNYPI